MENARDSIAQNTSLAFAIRIRVLKCITEPEKKLILGYRSSPENKIEPAEGQEVDMARHSRKLREIQLVASASRDAEDSFWRAYPRLWQAYWQPEEKRKRCEDEQESGHVCLSIDGAPRTGWDD